VSFGSVTCLSLGATFTASPFSNRERVGLATETFVKGRVESIRADKLGTPNFDIMHGTNTELDSV
jgi:hypothetical protein